MTKFVIDRPPKNDLELWWAARATFGVKIPRTKVCENHNTPFDAFSDAYFARHPQSMWLGSRGFSGKTFTLSLLGMMEMTYLGAFVSILGGSGAQAIRVQESMNELWFYEGAPKHLLAKPPTKFDTLLTNQGKARTLMASQTSVRGPHPSRLRIDEIDEADLSIIQASLGQPMRKKNYLGDTIETSTVFSSTHTYPDGPVTYYKREFQEKGFPIFSWCLVAGTLVRTSRGLVPIEEVEPGDEVVGWDEEKLSWSAVSWSGYTRTAETVVVTTESGRRIQCTADHQIATERGWVAAQELEIGDSVVCDMSDLWGGKSSHAGELEQTQDRFVHPLFQWSKEHRTAEVPAVWRNKTTSFENVRTMLSERPIDPEHTEQGSFGKGQSRPQAVSNSFRAGGAGGGVTGRSGAFVQSAGAHRDVHSGFPGGAEPSGGSAGLAAQTRVGSAALREEEGVAGETGLRSGGTLVRQDAPLVHFFDRVVSVNKAEVLPVYDLTVSETHSFVANGIVVHNCYKDTSNPVDGWLDPEEVERKRREIPAAMWRNEYDILEPNFEGRAIDEASVEKMFDPEWDVVDGKEGYYYQFLQPRDDRDYVTGVDWAKKQDFTIIATWDTTVLPWKLAAFEKINRRPWPQMVGRLNKRWAEYGGQVVSDGTGIGSVVGDYIEYPRGAQKADLTEITMAGRIRSEMVTEVVQAVENGDLLAPRIKSMYDDFRFVTPDDLYNVGSTSHLPDTIAATALAWIARKKLERRATQVVSLTRDASPWKI